MQFSESWLRSYCNPPISTNELATVLTMAGMEVESVNSVAPLFSGVVVGRIVSVNPHPGADRLRVCMVDAGIKSPDGPLQIVCGAPNAKQGMCSALALVGAVLPPPIESDNTSSERVLPKPFKISRGKIRGVESFGMLCAWDELGMGGDHAGIIELDQDAIPGSDIREYLDLDDSIFTLKLTPNLGHCLSIQGLARELSALTGSPLLQAEPVHLQVEHEKKLPVRVSVSNLCGRFCGRIMVNVNPQVKTPTWIVRRLERCGQRSVNVLVDISNYVMFETGQPNHIFDCDKIHNGLEIRWAVEGETLELLNGKVITLSSTDGVIADDRGIESLAGIMGGNYASVTDQTTTVYIEAAYWHPDAIAGRSRKFGFTTDAGHRFERGVDPSQTVNRVEYISFLIQSICGGAAGPIDDQVIMLPEQAKVSCRSSRASKVLGIPVNNSDIYDVFTRLGFAYTIDENNDFLVSPPSHRFDIRIEADLIEEIIKLKGYSNLPLQSPKAPLYIKSRDEGSRSAHDIRHAMANLSYHETINFSFVEERWEKDLLGNMDPIRLLNPIASPLAVMRSSLIPSLLSVLQYNLARKVSRVRIFELGKVFIKSSETKADLYNINGIQQPLHLAGLAFGPVYDLQWAEPDKLVDFFDVKGDIETLFGSRPVLFRAYEHSALHPGQSAAIIVDNAIVGYIGSLHPRWCQAYELSSAPVLFEIKASAVSSKAFPELSPIPRHHAVFRDLAFVMPSKNSANNLVSAIEASDAFSRIQNVRIFDLFQPGQAKNGINAHEKSIALRLEIQDSLQVMTDEQIQEIITNAIQVAQKFGAHLRT
jgi:phenylalanyl-tRNA synthetase beta chain